MVEEMMGDCKIILGAIILLVCIFVLYQIAKALWSVLKKAVYPNLFWIVPFFVILGMSVCVNWFVTVKTWEKQESKARIAKSIEDNWKPCEKQNTTWNINDKVVIRLKMSPAYKCYGILRYKRDDGMWYVVYRDVSGDIKNDIFRHKQLFSHKQLQNIELCKCDLEENN